MAIKKFIKTYIKSVKAAKTAAKRTKRDLIAGKYNKQLFDKKGNPVSKSKAFKVGYEATRKRQKEAMKKVWHYAYNPKPKKSKRLRQWEGQVRSGRREALRRKKMESFYGDE